MTASLRRSIEAAIAEGRPVRIDRLPAYEEPVDGIPLAMGRTLLLVHVINPDLLLPDGWAVLRVKDVAAVHSRPWDGFVARILADESLLPVPLPVPDLRLGAWAQLLADLLARGERVSVECEEADDGYFVGRLHTAGRDEVEIQHIGADGRLGVRELVDPLPRHHPRPLRQPVRRGLLPLRHRTCGTLSG
jgi:hypothetical protein